MPFLNGSRPPLPIRAFNRGGAILRRAGVFQQRLCAATLIEKAKRRCGYDDFGPGNCFDALSRLLDSCEREAHLNTMGRLALRSDTVRVLCNRLLIEHDRSVTPEIAGQRIR